MISRLPVVIIVDKHLTVTIPFVIFSQNVLKWYFSPFNEFQAGKFFKGPHVKFQAPSLGPKTKFLGKNFVSEVYRK